MAEAPVASVVIAAHDEEATIGRCLRAVLDGAPTSAIEVVVVCNGCTDATSSVARGFGPAVTALELPQPSKVAALNAGDEAATAFPRLYVDADVELPASTRDALVATLGRGPLFATPRVQLVTDQSSWSVRAYYRVWATRPSIEGGQVGVGVYAVSAAGRARFREFPDVIADDRYVHDLFTPDERVVVDGPPTVVRAPRTVEALLARRVRVQLGNAQLRAAATGSAGRRQAADAGRGGGRRWAARVLRTPTLWPSVPAFAYVTIVVRWRTAVHRRRGTGSWGRDATSRSAHGSAG